MGAVNSIAKLLTAAQAALVKNGQLPDGGTGSSIRAQSNMNRLSIPS